ncbi:hypothetical protein, partial [Escherichia coli]|uniref:hypothetical protein n=1 Tax=Escherichia coli TaxID=562 RepID=UPI001BE4D074
GEKSHFSASLVVEKPNWHNARQITKSTLIQPPPRLNCVRPATLKENGKKALRQKWQSIISA